jgi:hypothetical protein
MMLITYQLMNARVIDFEIDEIPLKDLARGVEVAREYVELANKQLTSYGLDPLIEYNEGSTTIDMDEWPSGMPFGDWFGDWAERHNVEVID